MMLEMARHIGRANALMHAGKWEKKSLQGTELRGKDHGHRRSGTSRNGSGPPGASFRNGSDRSRSIRFHLQSRKSKAFGWSELEESYAAADYLSLHVGLTPQTAGMINAESISENEGRRAAGELCARRIDR